MAMNIFEVQFPLHIGLVFVALLILCIITLLVIVFLKRGEEEKLLKQLVADRTYALEMENALIRTIFDSIPDVIFCKDLELRYTRVNRAFEDLFNLKASNILGKTDGESVKPPEHVLESWQNWDRRVMNERISLRLEEEVLDGYGNVRMFETVKTPLIHRDGRVVGLIGLARDITERKEFEDSLLAAAKAKNAFIANMSHEIRTPMNSIIGFSELATAGAPPKTQSYLNKINDNAKWLLQIINDMLDISKFESGKMELENIPFEIKDVFETCYSMIAPKADEKAIRLYFYAEAPEEPSNKIILVGDPVRLQQILINLISNAIKFTNVGMVKVVACVKDSTENSKTLYFEVKDSGIGMSEEQISRVFEPFMQADASTTRKYGGTGLGLAITKNLIELMGGTLQVASVKNLGSKFSFELTFESVDANSELMIDLILQSQLSKIEQPRFNRGEILVCEDNEMNQLVILEHLSRIGLNAVIATNGKEGVELVSKRNALMQPPFDLVLMDIHMPEMDGLEAAERIIKLNTGVPIVAMTANIMGNDKDIYRQCGMYDCVGKPFTAQELWACLLKYLEPTSKR